MSQLIIVESPTKAKTLSRFLGRDYEIMATMGHVRDLPEKRLGIEIREIQNDKKIKAYEFIPKYQSISGRKLQIKEIREKISKSPQKLILATDPDREGEAIAWHVSQLLGSAGRGKGDSIRVKDGKSTPFERIVFHEITESAISEALKHPRQIDNKLVDAQQARRILDRLVGYKLSPLLWNKLGKNWLSAGRVQSVAVRLIVEKEREIEAFKSSEYWLIDILVKQKNSQKPFTARLFKINDQKADFQNSKEAEDLVSELKRADYQVTKVEPREARRFPPPPYTTSTLQQSAANKFGWSARRTIKTAQTLYEEGFITYHRTDSTNIASEALSAVREYINKVWGNAYLTASPKIYKTKSKVAQEAHEAIRPSKISVLAHQDLVNHPSSGEVFPESLGRDVQLLYSLIWRRFISCQMNEAVFEQTNVLLEGTCKENPDKKYIFKAGGEKVKFDGWLKLYGINESRNSLLEEESQNGENGHHELPPLSIGQMLDLQNVMPLQKFTQPPGRFTEATLIKTLEERGIGRPSTYAPIIGTIQDRRYVEKIERKFHPTDLGKLVNDFLVKHFPDIFDIGFTARMEDELDEIANGKMTWKVVVSDFYSPFVSKLDFVFKEAEKVKLDLGTTEEKCPKCSSPLVVRLSKFGKFLACSTFPTCKFTKNLLEKAGISCPKCGSDMIVKKTRKGKQFYGCMAYPKCTFAAWKKEDIK